MSVKNKLSPQEQLRIFLEGLKDNVKIAEIPVLNKTSSRHSSTRLAAHR